MITIDLSEYNIQVKGDFFISIEHFMENATPENRLKFYGTVKPLKYKKSDCMMRKTSQGNWNYFPGVEVQFSIESVIYK